MITRQQRANTPEHDPFDICNPLNWNPLNFSSFTWLIKPQSRSHHQHNQQSPPSFRISIDVQNYTSKDISIKIRQGYLILNATHVDEQSNDDHFSSHSFEHRYRIPENLQKLAGADSGYELIAFLADDHILVCQVTAGHPELKNREDDHRASESMLMAKSESLTELKYHQTRVKGIKKTSVTALSAAAPEAKSTTAYLEINAQKQPTLIKKEDEPVKKAKSVSFTNVEWKPGADQALKQKSSATQSPRSSLVTKNTRASGDILKLMNKFATPAQITQPRRISAPQTTPQESTKSSSFVPQSQSQPFAPPQKQPMAPQMQSQPFAPPQKQPMAPQMQSQPFDPPQKQPMAPQMQSQPFAPPQGQAMAPQMQSQPFAPPQGQPMAPEMQSQPFAPPQKQPLEVPKQAPGQTTSSFVQSQIHGQTIAPQNQISQESPSSAQSHATIQSPKQQVKAPQSQSSQESAQIPTHGHIMAQTQPSVSAQSIPRPPQHQELGEKQRFRPTSDDLEKQASLLLGSPQFSPRSSRISAQKLSEDSNAAFSYDNVPSPSRPKSDILEDQLPPQRPADIFLGVAEEKPNDPRRRRSIETPPETFTIKLRKNSQSVSPQKEILLKHDEASTAQSNSFTHPYEEVEENELVDRFINSDIRSEIVQKSPDDPETHLLRMYLDVNGFDPSQLKLFLQGKSLLTVQAEIQHLDGSSKTITKKISLPDEILVDQLSSTVSESGEMFITAPMLCKNFVPTNDL